MKYFDDKQVKLISSWHQLSVNSDDEYMKFISNWICLNAICVHLYSPFLFAFVNLLDPNSDRVRKLLLQAMKKLFADDVGDVQLARVIRQDIVGEQRGPFGHAREQRA